MEGRRWCGDNRGELGLSLLDIDSLVFTRVSFGHWFGENCLERGVITMEGFYGANCSGSDIRRLYTLPHTRTKSHFYDLRAINIASSLSISITYEFTL
jgi:hypothetical protein